MRKFSVMALVFALLVSTASMLPASLAAPAKANYTLLVYMVGSDLESEGANATKDLQEMLKGKTSNGVNVLIETGGTLKWFTNGISNQVNQRWKIQNGKMIKQNIKLPKRNMGKPETLSDFIKWGVSNFPAKQYGIVMWDHGSGSVRGFGADEFFDHDMLTLPELKKAFSDASKSTKTKFEWIGFDSCLMATVETAQTLEPYANYLVASEELEPGHGWDYTPILNAINQKPTIKGNELGSTILKSFQAHASRERTADQITLSVTQLNQIKPLVKEIDALFFKLMNTVKSPTDYQKFAAIRRNTEEFGRGSNPADNTDMADLGDFAKEVRALAPMESDRVLNALKRTVTSSITSEIAPEATGLSIYFPYWNKAEFNESVRTFQSIGFNKTYEQFIRNFASYLTGDVKGIELPVVELKPNADDEIEMAIPSDQLDDVAAVYSILGMFLDKEETQTLILGTDVGVEYNEETGALKAKFTGEWVTLDGVVVTMDVIEEYDDSMMYSIPAMVNGEDADLIVFYEFESDTYEIIGYWSGIDEESGVVDRDITELEAGDKIVPIYELLDEETGDTSYEDGDELVWNAKLKLERTELDKGAYSFGFVVEDFAQNQTFTDFYIFDIE